MSEDTRIACSGPLCSRSSCGASFSSYRSSLGESSLSDSVSTNVGCCALSAGRLRVSVGSGIFQDTIVMSPHGLIHSLYTSPRGVRTVLPSCCSLRQRIGAWHPCIVDEIVDVIGPQPTSWLAHYWLTQLKIYPN
jgi:hypothetical protein